MRPVTSQSLFMIISDKFTEGYGAGSYRALLIIIIPIIILFVIGLAGNAAIKFNGNFADITGQNPKTGLTKPNPTTIRETERGACRGERETHGR